MTTLKPHLVRADTIDLQPTDHPSAKDHTRQQLHPGAYGYGHPGPHQSQALRHANEEAYHERQHSPRLAQFDHGRINSQNQTHMYDDTEDEDEDHMHDGTNGVVPHDGDSEDGDGNDSHDEDLDDDLLDKISSSPSIEDGKHNLSAQVGFVDYEASPALLSTPIRGIFPSPNNTPLPVPSLLAPSGESLHIQSSDHHPGRCKSMEEYTGNVVLDLDGAPQSTPVMGAGVVEQTVLLPGSADFEDIQRHLIPELDPMLEDCNTEQGTGHSYSDEDEWEDEDDLLYPDEFSSDDDDHDEISFTQDARFLDSGWGGECLREIEDIDFEFVYALHTFVATVEGQANATKGETMVLLDDSNSYWWLVRVVKDGSIGYLPAEHIETPTERLARLNKHRNIDLAQSMLGDNPEKSKNPLKKAMRRRNAKTVNFAAPTYYEPAERDWSDDEEHDEDDESQLEGMENGVHEEEHQAQQHQQEAQAAQIIDSDPQKMVEAGGLIQRAASDEQLNEQDPQSLIMIEDAQVQPLSQDAVQRSRKGNVRNTDSFFKDDTAETKKISLTPRLLRGDSDSNASAEPEQRPRPSLDTFDRLSMEEKPKDAGKKKEKKGMLSGLFKRKDKGAKGGKGETDEFERVSEDSGRSPQSKDSMDSLSKTEAAPERKPSKLQKAQPSSTSPKIAQTEFAAPQRDLSAVTTQPLSQTQVLAPGYTPPAPTGPAPVPPEVAEANASQDSSPAGGITPDDTKPGEKRSMFAPITDALRSKNSQQDVSDPAVKPVYSKRAKERFAIDDSESEDDSTPTAQSLSGPRSMSPMRPEEAEEERADSAPGDSAAAHQVAPRSTSKQSQSHEATSDLNQLTPVDTDGTVPSEHTASTSKPSPSLATHTPSTSRSTPTWSDASLRTYMDDDQGIRDLLIIVHDKSNITPVEHNHPLMTGLFANERTKLAEMQSQLDTMLTRWISKKKMPATAKV